MTTKIPEKIGNKPAQDADIDLVYEVMNAVDAIIDHLHTMEDQIARLQDEADTVEEKPKRWRAENGEGYWFCTSRGDIAHGREDYSSENDFTFNTGNYFRTEKEVLDYREKLLKDNEQ